MMTRWLVRTLATAAGLIALAGVFFVMKTFGTKDLKRERMREAVEATSAVRADLGREAIINIEGAPGFEEQVVVVVRYPDPPAEAPARKELVRNTNMTVRRIVHHIKDLKVVFEDEAEAAIPSWDGGVAVAGTPETVAYNYPVPIPGTPEPPKIAAIALPALKPDAGVAKPAPKPQKTGTVTLVTFPEADVFRGKERVGHTPLFNVELPVGTHLLTLVGADGARRKLSVPVKLGKNKPLKVNLDDLPVR